MTEAVNQIKELIAKAAKAERPDDAMKLSQAALNAANALCSIAVIEKK